MGGDDDDDDDVGGDIYIMMKCVFVCHEKSDMEFVNIYTPRFSG